MRTLARNSPGETPIAHGNRVSVLSLLLSAVLAVSAHAQEAPPPAQSATGVITDQDLAKSAHNPFEDFVKLFPKRALNRGVPPENIVRDDAQVGVW
jgi:hypothetical protein